MKRRSKLGKHKNSPWGKTMVFEMPQPIRAVAEALRLNGGQAYLVGGALRDLLLDREPKDYDIATDLLPDRVASIGNDRGWHVIPTGIRYGTVTIIIDGQSIEVTTFRSDGRYLDGRRPMQVQFGHSIEKDLARRDVTVNALALSWPDGRLVDPFGGTKDLLRRKLRAVGVASDRFQEDGLRMLRVLRLAAELEFSIDDATLLAIATEAEGVGRVASERIGAEMNRLMVAPGVVEALNHLFYTGLGAVVLPDLVFSHGFPQHPDFHAHPVLQHIFEVVRFTRPNPALRWAALFHDVGKPASFQVDEEGVTHFYGHDALGAEITQRALSRLRLKSDLVHLVTRLVRRHMFTFEMGDRGIRRLVAELGEEGARMLMELKLADMMGTGGPSIPEAYDAWIRFVSRFYETLEKTTALTVRDLAIGGHDVMKELALPPGPEVGRVLDGLLQEVLENPGLNRRELLLERIHKSYSVNHPTV